MTRYVSTRGGIAPVDFEEAVLSGFAADGGLFVPESIPMVSHAQLQSWSELGYRDLAFEVLSLYIERSIIPESDLRGIISNSYGAFEAAEVVNMVPLGDRNDLMVMELFHGPTLSFKDIAMGFLINVLDYFLTRRNHTLSIVLATTGDTGPAAAWAAAGKTTIDCWPLYPRGMITEEQERQMTTLDASNVHPVGVENCSDGGDDLDAVVAKLFADESLKERLNLSSVNSINWCRVMVQSVHYFYGYFRAVDQVGEEVSFSVPSGAFGNLFGGYLARSMGVPVKTFICANNANQALHAIFSTGVFARKPLQQTLSSAIDIVSPYNFWRFLYFAGGSDSRKLCAWMDEFYEMGEVTLDDETLNAVRSGFESVAVSDPETREAIKSIYEECNGYLMDPHTAVAVVAASVIREKIVPETKIICLSTAHPAKFPEIIRTCLGLAELPQQGAHPSLEKARKVCQHLRLCDLETLESALVDAIIRYSSKPV